MSDEDTQRPEQTKQEKTDGYLSYPTLLLLVSLPGVFAMAGYWLIDLGHMLPDLRDPVKHSIDENFGLWALWVYPSLLVFIGSLLYLLLYRVRETVRGRRVELALEVIWVLLASASLLSLLFYRSTAKHAPDALGEWASRFLLPFLIATAVAIAAAATQGERRRFLLLAGTLFLGALEVLLCIFMLAI